MDELYYRDVTLPIKTAKNKNKPMKNLANEINEVCEMRRSIMNNVITLFNNSVIIFHNLINLFGGDKSH